MTTDLKPASVYRNGETIWRDRPEAFFRDVLGVQHIFPKMVEMVESVARHRRTAVVGCNSSGKDFTAGRILLWWMSTRYPAKTVIIGPTHRQVSDIVWQEARSAHRTAGLWAAPGLGGGMAPRASRWYHSPEHLAVGFSTDNEYNIQGYHSPNLLVIVTEAHNVEQAHIDAIKRLNPARLLMTGNPLSAGGEFYSAFHESGDIYNTVQIAAADTPNILAGEVVVPGMVTQEDIEERAREWGEESALYIASILGQFPDNLEDAVVPRSHIMAAISRELPREEMPERAILAVDVARFGADKTVIYRRQGGECRKLGQWQGRDTQQVAGLVGKYAEEDDQIDRIVVDDTGVGGGVTDRLRESPPRNGRGSVGIVAFNGGATARQGKRYVNAITEAWLELAREFRDGTISIDNNPALIGQLSSRRYTIQGDRRMKLEAKVDYKRRSGLSPDDADALAMTTAGIRGGPNIRWI